MSQGSSEIRMLFFERKPLSLWYHDFQLHKRKLLPDADWQAFRGAYEPAFQDFIERQFAIADRTHAVRPTVGSP